MRRACRPVAILALVLALAGTASAQTRRWPTEKPPAPWPARPATFPASEMRTLGNGLRVVVVAQHEQPVVSAQLLVMAGAAFDPPGKGGVANLVAALLDQGTATRDAMQIAGAVDAAGAELTVLSGMDATFAQMTMVADGLGAGLDMLSEVVRTPQFPRQELERQRQRLRAALRASYADPAYIADAAFARLTYGRHPYGRPADGTPDSVSQIAREDLVAFHRQFYVPGRSVLAIVGDVEPSRAFAEADRAFGAWPSVAVATVPTDPPPAAVPRLLVVDIPDAAQTEVRVGGLAVPRAHADTLALDMAVRVLGGDGGNRLLQVLRTQRGLVYDVSAVLDANRDAGVVRLSTQTPPASEASVVATSETLRVIVAEWLRLFDDDGLSSKALDPVKTFAAATEPLGLETPGSISTRVLTALLYGRPLEELASYGERVRALTPNDVRRAVRAQLSADALTIVIVGNAAALAPALKKIGLKATTVVVPVRALDLNAEDLRRPATPPSVTLVPPPQVTPSDRARARSVVSRAALALGGLDPIRAVTAVRSEGEMVVLTPDGPLAAKALMQIQYPDRMRFQLTMPTEEVVQVYDAGHAWLSDSHGPRDASEAMRRDFEAMVARDWIGLFKTVLADGLAGRRLPDETGLAGRSLLLAEFWGPRLPPVRVAVDAADGRLVRISYQAPGPAGLETVDEIFDDYHVVGGILMPHRIVTRRDGVAVIERTWRAITANPALPPGLFDKPR